MSLERIVGIKGYIQTTYLAVYPDKLLLIDSGCRSDVEVILSYITNTLNRPITQLKVVVVSHMHPDHAGGAELLRKKTGCQIVTSESAQSWYAGLKGRRQHLIDLGLTYYVANRRGKPLMNQWYHPVLKADYKLSDGEKLPHFEDWTVFDTPGHTHCDISLWHQQTNQAYIGDLVLKIKDKLVSPLVINYPEQYKASLKKVDELALNQLILAHGGKVKVNHQDFEALIDKAPDEPREMKLLDVLDINLPKILGRFVARKLNMS